MDVKKHVMAITGGPCAGKTTLINALKGLNTDGIKVIVVSETATELAEMGLHPVTECRRSPESRLAYHTELLKLQLAKEAVALRMAEFSERPTLIICDRGALDLKGYSDQYPQLMANLGLRDVDLVNRYDSVFFMHSLAVDRPELYNVQQGNAHRHESVDTAKWRDGQLKEAWKLHPNITWVHNKRSMETKIALAKQHIANVLTLTAGPEL